MLRGHVLDVESLSLSADGWLASAGRDGSMRLWNLAAPDPIASVPLPLGTRKADEVAFLPDGRLLTMIPLGTGSDTSGNVQVWTRDVATLLAEACAVVGRNLSLGEWTRFFDPRDYRPTCEGLPAHFSLSAAVIEAASAAVASGDLDEARLDLEKLTTLDPRYEPPATFWARLCKAGIFSARAAEVLTPAASWCF